MTSRLDTMYETTEARDVDAGEAAPLTEREKAGIVVNVNVRGATQTATAKIFKKSNSRINEVVNFKDYLKLTTEERVDFHTLLNEEANKFGRKFIAANLSTRVFEFARFTTEEAAAYKAAQEAEEAAQVAAAKAAQEAEEAAAKATQEAAEAAAKAAAKAATK